MKRRPLKKRKDSGAPKWMVTYSDMITLILVFFILLFSMSQIDAAKFDAISDSFKNRVIFDFYPSAVPMENPTENTRQNKNENEFDIPTLLDMVEKKESEKDSLDSLMEKVQAYLENNDLEKAITANRTERGVVLVLQESISFDSGEATILETAKPFLKKVGALLLEVPNEIKVEGHTDSKPMSNFRYPSNWELSGARASSVTRYLLKEHDFKPERFSIAGYADTRPVIANKEKEMKRNRRVEIIILENNLEYQE